MLNQDFSNALRFLSIDSIENAISGHPGIVLGCIEIVSTLFKDFLKFNPNDPKWIERDRFVLSAGHGSALLYSLFYLTGYDDISIEDIKNFRQLNSKTCGHPEYNHLSGIECTTGPLGQGIANAVGFAFGLKMLAAKHDNKLFSNTKVYCLVGDGCLMEGISQEALSFAAVHNLNNLIIIFDDNSITIDGKTNISTTEDHIKRVEALNFNTIKIDGHSHQEIYNAFTLAQTSIKPFFISAKTNIGNLSDKQSSNKVHGSPLGKDSIEQMRKKLNWIYSPFFIPQDILNLWRNLWKKNEQIYQNSIQLQKKLNYKSQNKIFTQELNKLNFLPLNENNPQATRKSFNKILEFLNGEISNLISGSADLGESTGTLTKNSSIISKENWNGNYIHYGIREHFMAAMMNSLSILEFFPISSTFLVFSDYLKPALRLSALMELRMLYIFTHDSIFLGEDGPTHQPIEHYPALELIPNFYTFRPADFKETLECIKIILNIKNAPSGLILTRQNVPQLNLKNSKNISKGGYICQSFGKNKTDIIIIANGSELQLAIEVAKKINQELNLSINVISIPSISLFLKQNESYINEILQTKNHTIKRIAIEIYSGAFDKFVNFSDLHIKLQTFGKSAKEKDLKEYFEYTFEKIYQKVINFIIN